MHFARVYEKSLGYFQVCEAVYILVVKGTIIMLIHAEVRL